MRFAIRISGFVALLGMEACTSGSGSDRSTVRDSSGIEIVSNAAPAWEAGGWTLSAEPALRIGVVEGDSVYQLHRVRGALRLADGRIAIANEGSHEVRYFGATGRHLFSVGGSGAGPGEFRGMSAAIPAGGDTILVSDPSLGRSTLIAPNGGIVRTVPAASAVGLMPDGAVIEELRRQPADRVIRNGPSRNEVVLIRHPVHGQPDTLAVLPGDESVTIVEESGSTMGATGYRRPFGLRRMTSVHGGDILTADGAGAGIRVLDGTGAVRRIIRLAVPERPVTPADEAAYRDRFFGSIPAGPYRERAMKAHEGDAFPATLPAFQAMRHDRAGNLWIEEFRVDPDGPAKWFVVGPAGRWLGRLTTPAGLRVMDIGAAYLLGVARDELDVEHVLLYELTKH